MRKSFLEHAFSFGWYIGGIIQWIQEVYLFFKDEADPKKVIMMVVVLGMMVVWARHLVLHGPSDVIEIYNYLYAWYYYVPSTTLLK